MKKVLLASAALLSFASLAQAADLPRKSVAPVAYLPPAFTWTGFYAGVNAGAAIGAGGSRNGFTPSGAFLNPAAFPAGSLGLLNNRGRDDTGFQGGGQIGYNMQYGQFVFGAETDIQYRDTSGNRSNGAVGIPFAFGGPAPSSVTFTGRNGGDNYYGTVRGRLGFAYDRALFYATGGLAYGGSQDNQAATFTNAAGAQTIFSGTRRSDTNIGYALGGGVEYAFTNNITAKAEYLYVDLSDNKNRFATSANPLAAGYSFTSRGEDTFHVVRAGLNYKFW